MSITKDGNHIILSAEPAKVIIAEVKNQKACANYANSISGVFQYQNKANAILISGGKVYGFYLSNMTGAEVNACMKKQDMD